MGIIESFREFKQNRFNKAVAKNLKLVQNPKAIREDRAAAIDFFKDVEDVEIAVPALLRRFEYSLEHGINDSREKETVLAGILAFKEKALPFVTTHLQETTHIAWPIKTLIALADKVKVSEILESCLNYGEISFDQARVDKNYDILCYLMEYKSLVKPEKLLHFINDHDERVRFAAIEVLIEQDSSVIRESLERFLIDKSAENTRIRQAVILAFLTKGWAIQNTREILVGELVPGVIVNKNYRLEATGRSKEKANSAS